MSNLGLLLSYFNSLTTMLDVHDVHGDGDHGAPCDVLHDGVVHGVAHDDGVVRDEVHDDGGAPHDDAHDGALHDGVLRDDDVILGNAFLAVEIVL
uniref:Secreted protein n=1 Tax=Strongyloides venezuelensis TaxID=75913 RepID=A0A0K0F3S1_STRVS